MININQHRYGKEKSYFWISAVIGILLWGCFILGSIGLILIGIPIVAISLWITQQFFKAAIFGNAALVSPSQYPEVHKMAKETADILGLERLPHIFIVNGEGALNAMAVRFLGGQYVLLYASLVDLLLERNQYQELRSIIGHELAHHAAGHTSIWKNLLIWPASFIPFIGLAYRRACEYTADRIAAVVSEDPMATKRALVAVAVGSRLLNTDINALINQESSIPGFFGFLNEVYSSHPRLTKRLMALEQMSAVTMPLAVR